MTGTADSSGTPKGKTSLRALLRVDTLNWEGCWRNICSGDTLFTTLQAAVSDGSAREAVKLVGNWAEFFQEWRSRSENAAFLAQRLLQIGKDDKWKGDGWNCLLEQAKTIAQDCLFARGKVAAAANDILNPVETERSPEAARKTVDRLAFELESRPKIEDELKVVELMAWCAVEAANNLALRDTELDAAIQILGEKLKSEDVLWTATCIRLLLGCGRSVRVPIAVVQTNNDKGLVGTLELTSIERGQGILIRHPADAFGTTPKDLFTAAMNDSLEAARNMVLTDSSAVRPNFCWRLHWIDGAHIPDVDGPSAGGAAARGWWHLLTNKVPDEGVMVLAQIDSEGQLTGFSGAHIAAKVKAVVNHGGFDTIVVADSRDAEVAKETLSSLNVSEATIRVVCLPLEKNVADGVET